jgi:hypothetical protein
MSEASTTKASASSGGDYRQRAALAVLTGEYLPARDEVFDLAGEVGAALDKMYAYISKERSAEQANDAIDELLSVLSSS